MARFWWVDVPWFLKSASCFISTSKLLKCLPHSVCVHKTPTRIQVLFAMLLHALLVLDNSGNFSFTTPLPILFWVVYLSHCVMQTICVFFFISSLSLALSLPSWCETLSMMIFMRAAIVKCEFFGWFLAIFTYLFTFGWAQLYLDPHKNTHGHTLWDFNVNEIRLSMRDRFIFLVRRKINS